MTAVLALLEYRFFTMQTGRARLKCGIRAPANCGHGIFERHFRVQMTTLEHLVIFLPCLYLFAVYVHAIAAAIIGLFSVAGRGIYDAGYIREPVQRVGRGWW